MLIRHFNYWPVIPEKIGRPKLLNMVKVTRGVSGNKLKFKGEFNASMSFVGKTYNSKVYVVPGNNSILFGINWIVLFHLWKMPINSFCNKSNATEKKKSRQIEEFLTDQKNEFHQVFSEGLGCYTKTEVRFEIKEKVKPVLKPIINVPFSSLKVINKWLERLEKVEVIEKVEYSDWASPTV